MNLMPRGHADTTRFKRDLTVCDWCGEPATQILDFSIQLPDYVGVCEQHLKEAADWKKEKTNADVS